MYLLRIFGKEGMRRKRNFKKEKEIKEIWPIEKELTEWNSNGYKILGKVGYLNIFEIYKQKEKFKNTNTDKEMGCKGSKEAKEDKQINGDFERVNMVRFDEFFDNARQLLNNAEKIREGLEDNREKAAEISHTYLLKDPKYVDNVQVLFWTLSSEANGKITDTGVKVTSEVPYIQLEGNKVSADTFNLYQTFSNYVKTVTDGPETLKDILAKLEEMSKTLPELGKEAKTEIQGSSLGLQEKAQAIAKVGKNSTKLPKELKKCQNLSELLKQAATDLKELAPQLPGLLTKADEVGAKAAEANAKKPAEVFEKFHAGARKDEKKPEKKAEKKAAAPKEEKKTEEKKAEAPKTEAPKTEAPKAEEKQEAPKVEEKHEAPKAEEKHEAPKAEEQHEAPKAEDLQVAEEKPAQSNEQPEEVNLH